MQDNKGDGLSNTLEEEKLPKKTMGLEVYPPMKIHTRICLWETLEMARMPFGGADGDTV